jgi:hypothetical protein
MMSLLSPKSVTASIVLVIPLTLASCRGDNSVFRTNSFAPGRPGQNPVNPVRRVFENGNPYF